MKQNKIFTILTVFLCVSVCFGALEITARFFQEMDRFIVTKEFDPVIGWRLKPGHHWVRPSGQISRVKMDINSYGLRGEEFPAESAGERRIMVLGDSFVFSRHFTLDKTFTGRLETLLNEGSARHVRVINAGVPGYGTGQELLFMRKLADENGIVPDSYVLMIFLNDILDNLRLSYGNYESVPVKPGFALNAAGRAEVKTAPVNNLETLNESFRRPEMNNPWKLRSVEFVCESVAAFFESHPGILRFLMRLGVPVKLPRKPGLINGWYDDNIVNEGLPLMKALISEIKEEAVKRGASFKVAIIPSQVQIYPEVYKKIILNQFPDDSDVKAWISDPLKAQRLLTQVCKDLNIDAMDLYPVLAQHRDRRLYIPRDGHFNTAAHEIIAEVFSKWIGDSKEFSVDNRVAETRLTSEQQGMKVPAPRQGVMK